MRSHAIDPQSALPVFVRGQRKLKGLSIRELGKSGQPGITAPLVSRLERGLLIPSIDLLFRWSSATHDGRPALDLWASAVYAAAASAPDIPEFMIVRLADPGHDPDALWKLAQQCTTLFNSISPDQWPESWNDFGAQTYPRFSVCRSDPDALAAVWFALLRMADPSIVSATIRTFRSSASDEARMTLLMTYFVHSGGQRFIPVESREDEQAALALDPLWRTIRNHWACLPQQAQEMLAYLSQQLATKPPPSES